MAWRPARDGKLQWLRSEYERVTAEARIERPSIIAHSFGTYLVANLLLKYPEVRFDKVIFCGSIVAHAFDWVARINGGQINLMRNDYGTLDRWPRLARYLVRDSGPSGTIGFTAPPGSQIISTRFAHHRHSDYFHRRHFTENWIPTLLRTVVSVQERRQFTDALDLMVQAVSLRLGLRPELIRANVFVPDETSQLRIPEGLHYHMHDRDELNISIAPGTGCTGRAFSERTRAIALMQAGWGAHTLPSTELQKVDRRLQWIVSTPIPDPDVPGTVLGVMNVDGLDERKDLATLAALGPDLDRVAQTVALLFKRLN